MIKKTLSTIIFSMVISISFGQLNYFNNIYQINNMDTYGRSIIYSDSAYYIASLSNDIIDSMTYYRLSFCKADTNGVIQNYKSIGWGKRRYFVGYSGCMQKTSDGNFFSVGVVQDSIKANPYLVKVKPNFDTVFFKEYTDTLFADAEIQQGIETYDKGFILVGTKPGPGIYDMDILVIKADSSGNEQWHKFISLGSGIEYARNVIQTPDRGYLLGCYSYDNQISLSGDGIIIKLDSLGNTKWLKTIGGPNEDGVPVVALAKDSNYIVATSYSYYTEFLGFSDLKIQVLKLNKNNGNLIWNRQYDTIRTACYPRMIKIDDYGNAIIIGSVLLYNGYNYESSWLLKLNQNGDSLLYREFNKYNDNLTLSNRASDFCITNNQSIVVCGEVSRKFENDYKIWLLKMDSLGCLQPGCDPTAGIEEPHFQKPGQLSIFPNPATTQTTITYPTAEKAITLQIYNMLGQKIYEEKLPKGSSQTTIDTRTYKKGLYKVVVGESSASLMVNGK